MSVNTERNLFLGFVAVIITIVFFAHRAKVQSATSVAASAPTDDPIDTQIPSASGPATLPDFGDESIQSPFEDALPTVQPQAFGGGSPGVTPASTGGCNCGGAGGCGANGPTQFSSARGLLESVANSPLFDLYS